MFVASLNECRTKHRYVDGRTRRRLFQANTMLVPKKSIPRGNQILHPGESPSIRQHPVVGLRAGLFADGAVHGASSSHAFGAQRH